MIRWICDTCDDGGTILNPYSMGREYIPCPDCNPSGTARTLEDYPHPPKRPNYVPDLDGGLDIDDQIVVSNGEVSKFRYYAGTADDGFILAFAHGATSWTTNEKERWPHARRANEGECRTQIGFEGY